MAAPQKKDPNKYAKNADIQADTLVKTLTSVGGLMLMLIGLAGIALEFFKDGGVLTKALSWLFDTSTHMMLIPVIIGVLWLMNRMMSSTNPNESKKSGNIPMYAMIAIGAFYLFRFVTTGSI